MRTNKTLTAAANLGALLGYLLVKSHRYSLLRAKNIMQLNDPKLFKQACLINNHWYTSDSGSDFEIQNPADFHVIGQVPNVTDEQITEAIDAAADAGEAWANLLPGKRSEFLLRWYAEVNKNEDDLAQLITLEQGKPLAESKAEVRYAAGYLKWFAEQALSQQGDMFAGQQARQKVMVQYQPMGLCGCITPWNFPVAMMARKLAAALAAGCTVVAKPSELTPFSAMAFAELAMRARLPAGVCNWVVGDPQRVGELLTHSAKVKKISFTGSTRVGRWLMQQSAERLHKLSLELGGNAPAIVFDDADLDLAVRSIMAAKFRNNGQTCISINRLYVHQSVYEQVLEKLTVAVSALRIGNGSAPNVDLGPLVNKAAMMKFHAHRDDALAQGGKSLVEAKKLPSKGYFVSPSLIRDAQHGMLFCREETFGPLLAVIPFNTDAEVVEWANDSDAGLASYIYTQNLAKAMAIGDALQTGMVGINESGISNVTAPFGGIKQSGFGREGSIYGLAEYQQMKYTLLAY